MLEKELARVFVILFGILALLVAGEIMWRLKIFSAEYTRKFVHITAGVLISIWPWLVPFWVIQVMALLMIVVIYVSRGLKIFKGVHCVERKSYGEYAYAVGVLLAATFFQEQKVFASAVLVMAVGDGLAAVIGKKFGKRVYRVFGHKKTLEGSVAFYFICVLCFSLLLTIDQQFFAQTMRQTLLIAFGSALLMMTEAAGVYGLDNLGLTILSGLIAMAVFA